MADTQYFVNVEVTWGKQVGDEQLVESKGQYNWAKLDYGQSVVLENTAIIPNMNQMLVDAGALGLEMIDDSDSPGNSGK